MKYWYQKICKHFTNHKHRKLEMWSEGIDPIEYYWRCKVCGYFFWNYTGIEEKEFERIKARYGVK